MVRNTLKNHWRQQKWWLAYYHVCILHNVPTFSGIRSLVQPHLIIEQSTLVPWWVNSHWLVGWSLLAHCSTLWGRWGLRNEECGAAGCRLACSPACTWGEVSTAKSGPDLNDMVGLCHHLPELPEEKHSEEQHYRCGEVMGNAWACGWC